MTAIVQRWRDGRGVYMPAGEVIDPDRYFVALIDELPAKAFVTRHHYSSTFPAARYRVGLFERLAADAEPNKTRTRVLGRRGVGGEAPDLVGVAVFSQPCNDLALRPLPTTRESVELGRFVLLDRVPGNGETWFLRRAFDLIAREGITGVVSFSDPFPRTTREGSIVFGGHVGTIYQAHNAVYLGRARADTIRLLPDGRTLHARAVAKLRGREQGWRYVLDMLFRYGAVPRANLGGRAGVDAWIEEWIERLTRKVKHPGNHKYVWAFDRHARKALPKSKPYPKQVDEAA